MELTTLEIIMNVGQLLLFAVLPTALTVRFVIKHPKTVLNAIKSLAGLVYRLFCWMMPGLIFIAKTSLNAGHAVPDIKSSSDDGYSVDPKTIGQAWDHWGYVERDDM